MKLNRAFLYSFLLSVICYIIYLSFRGFGWDGDSFIAASQFTKFINLDLFRTIDNGTHPKLFTVILFGSVYQLTGGFYFLTFISIMLNALMIAVIINWVKEAKGFWVIALLGLLINIPWAKIVINCDNPAFSVPLIIFGLYKIYKQQFVFGAVLLVAANLFRPGAEFTIALLLVIELYQKRYTNAGILSIALAIALSHTLWGYLLIYPNKEMFWEQNWKFLTTSENIEKFKYSLIAFVPYIKSVIKQLFTKYSIILIIPAIIGLINIVKNKIKIQKVLLALAATIILPLGTFFYGTEQRALGSKHMVFTIVLPILAAFMFSQSFQSKIKSQMIKISIVVITMFILLFSGFTGNLKQGQFEANPKGGGVINTKHFIDIKTDVSQRYKSDKISALVAENFLTYILLDVGLRLNHIDTVNHVNDINYDTIQQYDLLVFYDNMKINLPLLLSKGFIQKYAHNHSYSYFIK